jgi:hypothetical protein
MVADDAGFAEVRVEDLKSSPQVRLQPWARVEGTLKIGTNPAPTKRSGWRTLSPVSRIIRGLPPYSISVETTTDAAGRFVFPRVPPVDVKVFHAPKWAGPGRT